MEVDFPQIFERLQIPETKNKHIQGKTMLTERDFIHFVVKKRNKA